MPTSSSLPPHRSPPSSPSPSLCPNALAAPACSPASDERDPAAYSFTDDFLLEAVDDFESREEMWEVLGKGNGGAVAGVVTVAARLDRRYCGQLQALALLSRARRLLAAADAGAESAAGAGEEQGGAAEAGQRLVELLRREEGLAAARDIDGRSLWHDLVAGEHLQLLRQLLPVAAAAGFTGAAPAAAAAGGGDGGPGELQEGHGGLQPAQQLGEADGQEQQQNGGTSGQQQAAGKPHCLDLPDAAGNTPLHLAADTAQLEAAQLLLDYGASPDVQNRRVWRGGSGGGGGSSSACTCCAMCCPVLGLGCTAGYRHRLPLPTPALPLPHACPPTHPRRLPCRDTSRYAAGGWSVRARGLDCAVPVPSLHQAPLHVAAEGGDLGMLRLLAGRGALLDLRDTSGSTPLHLALEAQVGGWGRLVGGGGTVGCRGSRLWLAGRAAGAGGRAGERSVCPRAALTCLAHLAANASASAAGRACRGAAAGRGRRPHAGQPGHGGGWHAAARGSRRRQGRHPAPAAGHGQVWGRQGRPGGRAGVDAAAAGGAAGQRGVRAAAAGARSRQGRDERAGKDGTGHCQGQQARGGGGAAGGWRRGAASRVRCLAGVCILGSVACSFA